MSEQTNVLHYSIMSGFWNANGQVSDKNQNRKKENKKMEKPSTQNGERDRRKKN